MDTQKNIKILVSKLITLLVFTFVLLPCMAISQEKVNIEEKEFRKPPQIHGTGTIDRVDKSVIVISDRQFPLAQNVVKRSSADEGVYSEKLKKGMEVGYELNDDKEIVTLWVMEGKK